jgi:hypothetical protein
MKFQKQEPQNDKNLVGEMTFDKSKFEIKETRFDKGNIEGFCFAIDALKLENDRTVVLYQSTTFNVNMAILDANDAVLSQFTNLFPEATVSQSGFIDFGDRFLICFQLCFEDEPDHCFFRDRKISL